MNKVLLGLLLGGVLGILDGATAWFTPAVRPVIIEIVIASTIKGMIAGIAAGWFARKVNSIPLGIAFGFAVGLVLAFAVAALPSETGEHYYFEIMLPGSILGAVVVWATQRYGKPASTAAAVRAAAIILVLTLVTPAFAAELTSVDAFDKLKTLSGNWTGRVMTEDGPTASIQYEITSGGNVVLERQFAGTEHEMITMYYRDGKDLVLTHYCAMGNQPRMRLNRAASTPETLVFDFDGVSGLESADEEHVSTARIQFKNDGQVVSEWRSAKGSSVGEPKRFYMSRR